MKESSLVLIVICVLMMKSHNADACSDVISSQQCERIKSHICAGSSAQLCRKTCCLCQDWIAQCPDLVASVTCNHPSVKTLCVKSCCKVSDWLDWSEWSTCSKTCGAGSRSRIRLCSRNMCQGDAFESMECNTKRCPQWSEWGSWSLCSASCSQGLMRRNRTCQNVLAPNSKCEGSSDEIKRCLRPPCEPSLPQLAEATSRDGSPLGDAATPCNSGNCSGKDSIVDVTCSTGFEWSPTKQTCEDKNECLVWNGGCEDRCVNAPGSFSCVQPPPEEQGSSCFDGYRKKYGMKSGCCVSDEEDSRMEEGCGMNTERDLQRIVGGEDAKLGRWPWMARLLIGGRSLCGGTLIHRSWVLTAAHCFQGHDVLRHGTVVVTVGMFNQTLRYERSRQIRLDKRIIAHPSFTFPQNDIALIQTDRPFDVTVFASPVCLPNGEYPKEGQSCYATGFGTVAFKGDLAPVLQQVTLPIVNKRDCTRSYLNRGWNLKDYQFCAGDFKNGGKDSCQGDSGGPLVCQRCVTCRWYIAGVTSFGHGCATAGFPGVYVSVEKFEDWISMETGMVVNKNRSCASTLIEWSRWSSWSGCTKSCGTGWRARARKCLRNGMQTTVNGCGSQGGNSTEQEQCQEAPCPRWGEWGQWSRCSKTCGGDGTRIRDRTCLYGVIGSCGDFNKTTTPCSRRPCPTWGLWGPWSVCSKSCGQTGSRQKHRPCLNGDLGPCLGGSNVTTMSCNRRPCPTWGTWSPWGSCSVTCGAGGRILRQRYCLNGLPGSAGCHQGNVTEPGVTSLNMTSEEKSCDVGPCSQWSQWRPWSSCSVSCGKGRSGRRRICLEATGSNQTRGYVMSDICVGNASEKRICKDAMCPIWSEWASWTPCTATCGNGAKFRSRGCLYANENSGCRGNATEGSFCNLEICPPPSCPEPKTKFTNGIVTCTNASFVDSQCFFSCHAGYVMYGWPVTQCDDGGTWQKEKPQCVRMTLNVTAFETSNRSSSYVMSVMSLSSGYAGTWMLDSKGNIFYMNNSIGRQVFTQRESSNLQWVGVDRRGIRKCANSTLKIESKTQVRVMTNKVFLTLCGHLYARRGISPATPLGWYWQHIKHAQPNDSMTTNRFSSSGFVWQLDKSGNIYSAALPSVGSPLGGSILKEPLWQEVSVPLRNGTRSNVSDLCLTGKFAFVVTQGGSVYQRTGISLTAPKGVKWLQLTTTEQPKKSVSYVISCMTSQWEDKAVVWVAEADGRFIRILLS